MGMALDGLEMFTNICWKT